MVGQIDPEVAIRLMLAGLLIGIVADRKLMREAHVNIAFTRNGLIIEPDASTARSGSKILKRAV